MRKPVEPHLLNCTTLFYQAKLKQPGALWPIILIKNLLVYGLTLYKPTFNLHTKQVYKTFIKISHYKSNGKKCDYGFLFTLNTFSLHGYVYVYNGLKVKTTCIFYKGMFPGGAWLEFRDFYLKDTNHLFGFWIHWKPASQPNFSCGISWVDHFENATVIPHMTVIQIVMIVCNFICLCL